MDSERDDRSESSQKNRLRRLGAVVAIVGALGLLVPASGAAQNLPTVDELESGQVDEPPPEQEQDEEEQQAADEEDIEKEQPQPAEGQPEQPEGEAAPAAAEGTQEGSQEGSQEGQPEQSEGEAGQQEDARQKGEQTGKDTAATAEGQTGDDGEKAGEQEGEQKEDDLPGEVIDEKTETKKEMAGRVAPDNKRRVQDGLNVNGVQGFQHMASAEPRKSNTYAVSFFGEISSANNVIRADDNNSFVAGRLALHAQPIKYFSANLSLGARNNVNNFGRPEAMLSQGDLSLGLRGHYDPTDFLYVSGDLTFDAPTGFGTAGLDFSGLSVTPRLLATLKVNELISDADVPLTAHLNFGYRVDNTQNMVPDNVQLTRVERFAHGISAYNYVEFGLGVEYALPYVTPFFSWDFAAPVAGAEGICSGAQPLPCASEQGFASFPDRLSLGVKAEPVEQLLLHAGLDLSLTARDAAGVPATPPYMVTLGASWTIDPEPKIERITKHTTVTRQVEKMPPRGHIVGTVVNAKTGEPVSGAKIHYTQSDRSPQISGDANGKFHSYAFPPETEVAMQVTHPDYESAELTKTVEEGEQTLKVELKPATGTVTGRITSADGSPIAAARVKLVGPETKTVETNASGRYSASVKPGQYTVAVTAKNHLASGGNVGLEVGDEQSLDVRLKGAPTETVAQLAGDKIELDARVAFESGSAKLKEESTGILDQVAAVLFENPSITKIQVAGHTDSSGAKDENKELSRQRAEAVKTYLTNQGVAADRLVTEGFGEAEPLVPNITPSNRKMNRRVEFKVLERR